MPNEGDLLRPDNDHPIYVIEGGRRRWIPDPPTLVSRWSWDQVQVLPAEQVNAIPLGEPIPSVMQAPVRPDGALVAAEVAIFVIEGGKRRHIPDPATFEARGHKWDLVQKISPAELNAIPLGEPIPAIRTLQAKVDSFLGAGHYMETSATMTTDGKLSAITRTRTITWFGGFTGGVKVVIADGNGVAIGASTLHSYGVDGTAVGTSDRTESWSENIDPGIAAQAASLTVFHGWTPKVPIDDQIRIGIEVGKMVITLIQIIQASGGHAAQGPRG